MKLPKKLMWCRLLVRAKHIWKGAWYCHKCHRYVDDPFHSSVCPYCSIREYQRKKREHEINKRVVQVMDISLAVAIAMDAQRGVVTDTDLIRECVRTGHYLLDGNPDL